MNFLIKLWNKDNWIGKNPNWTDEEYRKYKKALKILIICAIVGTIVFSIIVVTSPSLSESAIRFWHGLGG
jgi:hypothetical protein